MPRRVSCFDWRMRGCVSWGMWNEEWDSIAPYAPSEPGAAVKQMIEQYRPHDPADGRAYRGVRSRTSAPQPTREETAKQAHAPDTMIPVASARLRRK